MQRTIFCTPERETDPPSTLGRGLWGSAGGALAGFEVILMKALWLGWLFHVTRKEFIFPICHLKIHKKVEDAGVHVEVSVFSTKENMQSGTTRTHKSYTDRPQSSTGLISPTPDDVTVSSDASLKHGA